MPQQSEYFNDSIYCSIALIETASDIPIGTGNVAAIPIATEPVPAGSRAIVSGWGQTSHPGTIPETLRFIEKGILSNEECRERLRERGMENFIFEGKICAFERAGVGKSKMYFVYGFCLWGRPYYM
jgi:hypothetical protein